MGNSITEGTSIATPSLDAYPADLNRFLGDDHDVRNFGKSGRTLLKKGDYPLWNEEIFSDAINFDPEIVIILLGTNDTKPQNWVFKDEFLTDYYAMIDTFKQGTSDPEIYICYPPPSFSDAYDIRDSVLVADIISMITQIADSLGLTIIDFNTPFLDKSDFMPDGIHPLVEGSELMAKIVYEELTGNAIEQKKENNVTFNKKALQLENELPELIDLDLTTGISFDSESAPVVINLLDSYSIDMIQIHFVESPPEFSYTISASQDSTEWSIIVDSSLAGDESKPYLIAKFDTLDANFIRFEIPDGSLAEDSTILISEMKVFESREVHAPLLSWTLVSSTTYTNRIRVYAEKASKSGEYLKLYRQQSEDNPFSLYSNYRATDSLEYTIVIPFGSLNRFYGVAYNNGVEIESDTLTINSLMPTGINDKVDEEIFTNYSLSQNYPNPFNPSTTIEFFIPKTSHVSLNIYNAMGQGVAQLVSQELSAGVHFVEWDAAGFVSGVYFYQLKSDNIAYTKKMILLK
ncbi:MAG: GDSL-type esterase/lipase family protein [Ignavibacteria bacterium]